MSLFEEFVQNHEIYFFEDDISQEIFELPSLVEDMSAFNEHAK